jgi:hypothetical protein
MLTYLKDIRSTSLRVGKASRIIAEVTSYIVYSKGRFHTCLTLVAKYSIYMALRLIIIILNRVDYKRSPATL